MRVKEMLIDNLRRMLGIRRIDKMRNEKIIDLCSVKKNVNKFVARKF